MADGTGDIVLSGLVRSSQLDTSTFSVGDDLYLGVSDYRIQNLLVLE